MPVARPALQQTITVIQPHFCFKYQPITLNESPIKQHIDRCVHNSQLHTIFPTAQEWQSPGHNVVGSQGEVYLSQYPSPLARSICGVVQPSKA